MACDKTINGYILRLLKLRSQTAFKVDSLASQVSNSLCRFLFRIYKFDKFLRVTSRAFARKALTLCYEKSMHILRLRKLMRQAFCAAKVHAIFQISCRNTKMMNLAKLIRPAALKVGFRNMFFYSILVIGAAVQIQATWRAAKHFKKYSAIKKMYRTFTHLVIQTVPTIMRQLPFEQSIIAPPKRPVKSSALLHSAPRPLRSKPAGPPCVLAYWGIVGRGDQCRILLKHLGVNFEDKFYTPGDDSAAGWPKSKDSLGMIFPNLPYFKCGDTTHAETLPVLRSICRHYRPEYLGRNQTEQA